MHPGRLLLLPPLLAAVLALSPAACGFQLDPCGPGDATPGKHLECPVPGHTDRAFDLHVPAGWDGVAPLPVIYAFHGGAGNRAAAARVTCPDGDRSNPACLVPMATAAGFAVVLPDGTGSRPLRNIRTWNAGGGRDGWNCTSGGACREGVDDLRYLDDLHAAVGRVIPIDPARVHATGISNGGALAHRWACERPDVLASIAPVGGANQFEAAGGTCLATGPAVAVLHVHGTADPCWRYEASTDSCIAGEGVGVKAGVDETMEAWRQRNGCSPDFVEATIADTNPGDGATARLRLWPGCQAAVQLLRIDGGGHTWPDGYAYLGEDRIGPVWRDLSGNSMILQFFHENSKFEGWVR